MKITTFSAALLAVTSLGTAVLAKEVRTTGSKDVETTGSIGATGLAIEGDWSYSRTVLRLKNRGFNSTVNNCLPTGSHIAEHCTEDYQNYDGVRLSIAVRNTFDSWPNRIYRIKCTANCSQFSWRDIR